MRAQLTSYVPVARIYVFTYYVLTQGCTNHGHQITRTSKFCAMTPQVCGSSVWNVRHFTPRAPRILRWSKIFVKFVCSRIIAAKSSQFSLTTYSASLTNRTVLSFQWHDCNYYVSRQIMASSPLITVDPLIKAHTTLRTLPSCDISWGSLTLPAHEAGDFVE